MQLSGLGNVKISESEIIFNFKCYNHLYLILARFRQAACLHLNVSSSVILQVNILTAFFQYVDLSSPMAELSLKLSQTNYLCIPIYY